MNVVKQALGIARGQGLASQLVRGGAGSVVLKGANALLQLLTTAILARSLAVDEFGIYAYVLATTTLLAIPAHAGIPTLIVRLTASYQANAEWGLLVGLWRRTRQFLLLASMAVVLLTIGYFVLTADLAGPGDGALRATLIAALVIIPLRSVEESRSAALRGVGKIVTGQVSDQLIGPLLLAILLVVVLLTHWPGLSAPSAMALHALATLGAMLFATFALSMNRPGPCKDAVPEYRTGEWVRSVIPLSLLAGGQVVLQQTGSVLLGVMQGVEAVAPYRIAIQGAAVVGFGLLIATTVISPHLARMHALGDTRQAQAMITASARIVAGAALALTVLFVAFGRPFIEIAFGARYGHAYAAMVILCIGMLIKAAAGPAAAVLTMTGHERDAFLGVLSATVASVIFSAILIPVYDIEGAAVASMLAFSVWSLQLTRLAYRRTGFRTSVFGVWRRAPDGPQA